jgi:hypothetical protein
MARAGLRRGAKFIVGLLCLGLASCVALLRVGQLQLARRKNAALGSQHVSFPSQLKGAAGSTSGDAPSTLMDPLLLSSHEVRPHFAHCVKCKSGPGLGIENCTGAASFLPLCTVQCVEGANDVQRVCTFRDIYMFNGSLYYVVPESGAWTISL